MLVFFLLYVIEYIFGFLGYNDNGVRSLVREQFDEYGKIRFLSLDFLYNGGMGWFWYVLC